MVAGSPFARERGPLQGVLAKDQSNEQESRRRQSLWPGRIASLSFPKRRFAR